jgi:hypothetical protein
MNIERLCVKITIDLSDDLIEKVIELSGKKTAVEAVTVVIEEFVREKSTEAFNPDSWQD